MGCTTSTLLQKRKEQLKLQNGKILGIEKAEEDSFESGKFKKYNIFYVFLLDTFFYKF